MKLDWGKSLLIFFTLFLSLSAVFIVFSLRQNNDLVTEDYYEKGADYMHDINIQKRSKIFTDSIAFLERDDVFELDIAPGLVRRTDEFKLFFFRPSDKGMDVKLKIESDTIYFLKKQILNHGRYKLYVSWQEAEKEYRIVKDLMIK